MRHLRAPVVQCERTVVLHEAPHGKHDPRVPVAVEVPVFARLPRFEVFHINFWASTGEAQVQISVCCCANEEPGPSVTHRS
eukprot:COSAG01_NODE_11931_length_1833_cov_1.504037_2_plen_81_part_00